jgi:hypothetical protein
MYQKVFGRSGSRSSSVVEYSIAIIVGCMPGFAKCFNVHISQSRIFKWFRSKLCFGTDTSSHNVESKLQQPQIITFGSPGRGDQAPYVEVTDSMLLESQISSSGDFTPHMNPSKEGIYRSVHIMQHT